MEAEETMVLRDLPVSTRNYTIIDNVTGKPIDQATYSLTIDKEVVKKLNRLKAVNEEKVRQASLRNQYSDSTFVTTFTPQNNNVFSPIYEGEYIDAEDFVTSKTETITETHTEETELAIPSIEELQKETVGAEVIQSDDVLSRVVARDPSEIPVQEPEVVEEETEPKPELDYITADTFKGELPPEMQPEKPQDNSVFTPEKNDLQAASEQIVNIDTTKLKEVRGSKLESKSIKGRVDLERDEIREGKGIAWLAYLLFFIPLLFNRNNRFVRIHANEGLELNIMEIIGAGLAVPFFVMTTATGTLHTVFLCMAILGIAIVGACVLTMIPMMILAMCGAQFQIPWLWKSRMIRVTESR